MLWLALGCSDPDPTGSLPDDGFVVGTPAAVAAVSRCLRRFPESEAAALGDAWALASAGCTETLFAEGGTAELRCGSPPPPLAAALSGHELRFGMPRGASGILAGSLDQITGAALTGELLIPIPEPLGSMGLFIPASGAAGSAALADEGAFLHVRARPAGGIDIAGLVPENSQADSLFDLRSTLLSGAVLQGTWELAAYPPHPGGSMPELVLGLGVRSTTAPPAVTAFAEALQKKWSVKRDAIAAAGWQGECLRGLNIMPEFEPCFLLRDDALAIGWNESAVRTGTAPGPRRAFETGLGAVIDTRSLTASDQVISALFRPDMRYPPVDYPLGRIELNAHRTAGYLAVAVAAEGCP